MRPDFRSGVRPDVAISEIAEIHRGGFLDSMRIETPRPACRNTGQSDTERSFEAALAESNPRGRSPGCLLYTSDAADE